MSRFFQVDDLLINVERSGRTSPLDFLAQVAYQHDEPKGKNWVTTSEFEGKEKIMVVPGPTGVSIRLHKGTGKLNTLDLSKPFLKKCRNRECNKLGGQSGKPRSIYCSKKCQSREQNLRQGRIKNGGKGDEKEGSSEGKSKVQHTKTPSAPSSLGNGGYAPSPSSAFTSRSSPGSSSVSSPGSSTSSPIISQSGMGLSPRIQSNVEGSRDSPKSSSSSAPSPSHTEDSPFHRDSPNPMTSLPSSSPSPFPLSHSPLPPGFSMSPSPFLMSNHGLMSPSPLTLRLGMTPSPLPMSSPSPNSMGSGSSFSPIQMTANIASAQGLFLPKPQPQAPHSPVHANPNNATFSPEESGKRSPPTTQSSSSDSMESLTLAPIRT
eukprot:TRINITY_DN888_c0_g1_i1.p1 TRINITY_DN888_c0_g1~~TRINITY_DN888_c0_g1_i1.p1  ORF type:complete len:376 (-),score=105.50 TRINITY_DN888_c0_g1_i1:164-1291(-)